MIDMFELLKEHICSDCINSSENCYDGGGFCPIAMELDDLEKICNKAEEVAEAMQHDVSNNDYLHMTYEDAYGWR